MILSNVAVGRNAMVPSRIFLGPSSLSSVPRGFKCRWIHQLPKGRQAAGCETDDPYRTSFLFAKLRPSPSGTILEQQVHRVP